MNPTDSPALKQQSKHYPERYKGRVPKAVRMLETVTADAIPGLGIPPECRDMIAVASAEYPVWVNMHGAVSVLLPNGKQLGLKPDEFEVTEWHEQLRNAAR